MCSAPACRWAVDARIACADLNGLQAPVRIAHAPQACGLLCKRGRKHTAVARLSDTCDCAGEFLYDNVGPGIKGSRVKAHMRRAEAKKRLGMLADAVLDLQAGLDNIADLSMEDKRQLRDLIESFKGEKEVDERVKRLREIAGGMLPTPLVDAPGRCSRR